MSTLGWAISPHTGRTYPATLTDVPYLIVRLDEIPDQVAEGLPLDVAESYGWRWVPDSEGAQEAADLARQDAHYRTHPRTEADS